MEKIKTRMILEILGRPKEHIVSSLNLLLDKLSKEKGVLIVSKDVKEPIEVPDSKDLYTTFAQLEVDFDNLETCIITMFTYLPANVEIISPEELVVKNTDLNSLTNSIVSRMHTYDAIAKKMLKEREFLVTKLKEVAPQLFKDYKSQPEEKKG